MRFVTWNCRGAFEKKSHVASAFGADVLLVQECAPGVEVPGFSSPLWYPPYDGAKKGTGLYVRNGWTAEWMPHVENLPWVRPARLGHPGGGEGLTLLAVWTNKNKNDGRPPYAEQFAMVLERHAELIIRGRCIVAGDLNTSVQGPSKEPHLVNLDTAKGLGLVSAYHHANDMEHGGEPDMTLRWVGPGRVEYFYHCDFIFVSSDIADNTASHVVPLFADAEPVSDHQPVVADLRLH
jgi:exonuclease III